MSNNEPQLFDLDKRIVEVYHKHHVRSLNDVPYSNVMDDIMLNLLETHHYGLVTQPMVWHRLLYLKNEGIIQ